MTLVSVKYCDIPLWLHAGDFYRNLNADDPEEFIDVPADCFAEVDNWPRDENNSEGCFCQLVRVTLFWMLDEVPVGMMEFCTRQDTQVWQNAILSVAGAKESKLFDRLLGVQPNEDRVPFDMIIKTGKLELVLLAANQMKKRETATTIAAKEGNLPVLQFLHEQGFRWNGETCRQASMSGHLDCLQYAHKNGCHWDFIVYCRAAEKGHLHIMQYAHQQGLTWHLEVVKVAAQQSQLACLQFAHENGCHWDFWVYHDAARNGHLHIMQYAH